jgi:hypothetical protein
VLEAEEKGGATEKGGGEIYSGNAAGQVLPKSGRMDTTKLLPCSS